MIAMNLSVLSNIGHGVSISYFPSLFVCIIRVKSILLTETTFLSLHVSFVYVKRVNNFIYSSIESEIFHLVAEN